MADDNSTNRDTEVILKLADSPVSPPLDEQATEKIGDPAGNEIIYLTGLRLKIVADT